VEKAILALKNQKAFEREQLHRVCTEHKLISTSEANHLLPNKKRLSYLYQKRAILFLLELLYTMRMHKELKLNFLLKLAGEQGQPLEQINLVHILQQNDSYEVLIWVEK
jgi:hypothetical protein